MQELSEQEGGPAPEIYATLGSIQRFSICQPDSITGFRNKWSIAINAESYTI
jgi:hypothetical protein